MISIYYNNRCGKCRTALAAIVETGEEYEMIEYLTDTPTVKELEKIVDKLQLEPIDIVRTKEPIYKEKFAGKNYTKKEWLKILHENPILIERPIIVKDHCAVIARSEEKLNEILK
ncbi:MAG: ArsC/Spx/MgsR family protein [Bacteroidota bacterium]